MADTKPFLVEIGTEELPPKSLRKLAHAFLDLFDSFARAHLLQNERDAAKNQFFFSPRRLAIYAPAVLGLQPDRTEERLGPALAAAFDKEGNPTKAAEGFAKSCGVTVGQLERRQTEKGERLAYTFKLKGKTAAELLPQIVNEILAELPIPKRMRWGTSKAEFVRPVHWVVMLLGEKPLKAEILGVKAGNKTHGHRFLHPGAIVLKNPSDYRKALAQTGKVLVDDRTGTLTKKIASQVTQAAKKLRGKPQLDPALLEEVAALVEWPVTIRGSFDKKFLALPDEVIMAVLETQQRYFPLRDTKGKLLPHFIAISNIKSKKPAKVRRGNERVIVPRLTDAMFFWDSDRKTKLEARLPELDHVVFQKQLGSYGDKSRRVARLSETIAKEISGEPELAERAARLCKCDLVTGMVGEFPELQGIMGGYYARHDDEPEEVARAIAEHYRPRSAGDVLPSTKTGQALAIADKLDTITRIFSIGQKPTGEKDPFGLRRAGLGLMRIAIECSLEIDLHKLIKQAQAQLPHLQAQHNLEIEIYNFLTDRLRAYYQEIGIRNDVFNAVDLENPATPMEFHRHLLAVQDFLALPEARNLAVANKRIQNILSQAGLSQYPNNAEFLPFERALLQDEAEHTLYKALETAKHDSAPLYEQHRYSDVLRRLAALRIPVDKFFEQVLVMTKEETLRTNRLALLQRVRAAFLRIADIGELQVE